MGTLGAFLSSAREALGIDLRDAAQQTRISVNYLKALEEEDFARLPGEVFVKGFLKNYARFLNLPESEVLKRYCEQKPKPAAADREDPACEQKKSEKSAETPLEPFIWGAGIFLALIIFLFTAVPGKHQADSQHGVSAPSAGQTGANAGGALPEKLYLEVDALEDTWVLVRTDSSPQKKAVLKRGESLIWSADEGFLISYSNGGAVKLLLNGEELMVKGAKNAVVRDLAIGRSGIVGQQDMEELPAVAKPKPRPKPKPLVQAQPVGQPEQPQAQPQLPSQPRAQEKQPQAQQPQAQSQPQSQPQAPAAPTAQPEPAPQTPPQQ